VNAAEKVLLPSASDCMPYTQVATLSIMSAV